MDQTYDKSHMEKGVVLAGLDESGVSAIAGPIVAACVSLPIFDRGKDLSIFLAEDSKKLSEAKVKEMAMLIKASASSYGIGLASANEVDLLGVHLASSLSLGRALQDAVSRIRVNPINKLIVDGNLRIETDIPYANVAKADGISLCVACASILAKDHRNKIMERYDKLRPEYNFKSNKGYRSEAHYKGLDERGLWPSVHRTRLYPLSLPTRSNNPLKKRLTKWREKTLKEINKGISVPAYNLAP